MKISEKNILHAFHVPDTHERNLSCFWFSKTINISSVISFHSSWSWLNLIKFRQKLNNQINVLVKIETGVEVNGFLFGMDFWRFFLRLVSAFEKVNYFCDNITKCFLGSVSNQRYEFYCFASLNLYSEARYTLQNLENNLFKIIKNFWQ